MKRSKLAALGFVAALISSSASAADFTFAGSLANPDEVLLFNFTANGSSTVTLRSYSYAGGTQANGNVVSAGGFDPLLALYKSDGTFLGSDDDGSQVVDPSTGLSYDVLFSSALAAGDYTVALTAFPKQANGSALNLANPALAFNGIGELRGRTASFAFDVLGVSISSGPGNSAVPEPATWAMMLMGFGAVGYSMRRRKLSYKAVRPI